MLFTKFRLFRACKHGKIKVVEKILKNHPECINWIDGFSYTPLHQAAIYKHFDIVELLLANGADINAAYKDNRTPLAAAVFHDYPDVMEYLLKLGADIEGRPPSTPLIDAVLLSRTKCIKILIKHGANRSAKDSKGKTAYDWSLYYNGDCEFTNQLKYESDSEI
jgi:hypothetical protein